VRLLIEVGDYPRAEVLARRACAADDTNLEVLGWLGWALQYGEDRDLRGAEEAFDTAWQRMPADDKDPWVLSGRGDCRHLQGDRAARSDFEEALELAESHPSQTAWTMSVAGWCRFRLGDLSGAARAFLEQTSIGGTPGSEAFDLALVTLCRGRAKRAEKQYDDALRAMADKHPLFLRGMVTVALVDLRDAFADGSADADDPAAQAVLHKLTETLERLPEPPGFAFVDSQTVGADVR
jgi:tetratricopeptide (TPR) repeat protein